MECLVNRIGIKGCGAPSTAADTEAEPPAEALPVLFINSLPGVTLQKIDSLTDDEQETFLEVWENVVLRSLKKFEILVKAELNKCYRLSDKEVVECLICESKELFDVALWYLHGSELMIEITSTDNLNEYTTVGLEKAEALKGDFYGEFQAALSDAVKSISPNNSVCVPCCVIPNETFSWVVQLP